MDEGLTLRITGVEPGDEIAGARKLTISTTRGAIPLILHAAAEKGRAALCVSGAMGGYDGPSMLYPRLGLEMPRPAVVLGGLRVGIEQQDRAAQPGVSVLPLLMTDPAARRVPPPAGAR